MITRNNDVTSLASHSGCRGLPSVSGSLEALSTPRNFKQNKLPLERKEVRQQKTLIREFIFQFTVKRELLEFSVNVNKTFREA